MSQQHGENHDIPEEHHVVKAGGWLPADHRIHKAWLGKQIDDAKKNPKELIPCLKDFKAFIEGNPRIYMYFNAMYEILNKHIFWTHRLTPRQVR